MMNSVEFALHPQHETSCDSETQMKEDFNYFWIQSRKRLRNLPTDSWKNMGTPQVDSPNELNFKRTKVE